MAPQINHNWYLKEKPRPKISQCAGFPFRVGKWQFPSMIIMSAKTATHADSQHCRSGNDWEQREHLGRRTVSFKLGRLEIDGVARSGITVMFSLSAEPPLYSFFLTVGCGDHLLKLGPGKLSVLISRGSRKPALEAARCCIQAEEHHGLFNKYSLPPKPQALFVAEDVAVSKMLQSPPQGAHAPVWEPDNKPDDPIGCQAA